MKSKFVKIMICTLLLVGATLSCRQVTPPDSGKGDQLIRSTPEAQGVATEGIIRFVEEVGEEELEVHSLMILRHGKVISEAWWYPYRRDIPHVMNSISKTFISTAIGFAVQEKRLSVDDKVISFFPDDLPEEISPHLQELAVKHLLTMSVGQDTLPVFTADNSNWAKTFLATPIQRTPGTHFHYSSPASYMLAAILQKVTGENALDYLTPRLFEPLGIENPRWEMNTEGIVAGGWGMRLKTADMAKLGQLYLQKGKWNGQQLLPESWIEEATTAHIYQRPDRTEEENANDEAAQGYGYQIWRNIKGTYRADGARGQFIVVMPEQDAVIAITANVSDNGKIMRLIREYLYPVFLPERQQKNDTVAEMYGDLVSGLQLAPPFMTPDDQAPRKNETHTYRIASNEWGIDELTFAFLQNGDCRLTLGKEGTAYDFLFGWDQWRYGETEKAGPYYHKSRCSTVGMTPFAVCGYGSWTTPATLSLRLLYLMDSRYENFECVFTDEGVTVRYAAGGASGQLLEGVRRRSKE